MKHVTKLTDRQKEELKQFIKKGGHSGKEVQRAQSVLFVDRGTLNDIPEVTGLSRKRAFTLRALYVKQGASILLDRAKGKPKELLTGKQRKIIETWLNKKTPEDFGYEGEKGWTTGMLGATIEKEFKVTYKSKTSLYLIFKQAKFTYHKPGRVYQKRDPKEVEAWEAALLPELEMAFNDPDTVILCEDEMSLSSQTTTQKVWLPEGQYPLIEVSSKKESKSLFGYLNLKTGQEHAFVKDWQNMYSTVETLTQIRKHYPTQKILLLWDQCGWHKGSVTKTWIDQDKNTSVISFPRSAPDENPQEHVWKAGRSAITHNRFIPDIKRTALLLAEHLNVTNFPYNLLGLGAVS